MARHIEQAREGNDKHQDGGERAPGAVAGSSPDERSAADVEVADSKLLLRLSGPNESHLRVLSKILEVDMGLRGDTIHVRGPASAVQLAQRVLLDLVDVLERGTKLGGREIARAAETLRKHPDVRLRDLFEDVVLVASHQKVVSPKGVAQQLYINAIRNHDIVFGIGPAGTGKTYLAMAMAVRALQAKEVKRIILTRPAVEAGEKLGFLPGDLAEKVNPYLRPLYDALHDMMDLEKAEALLERGTIEVAPLAFMRGRTLNDSFVILDEAQNTTADQMKMFLTRLGYDAKAVITGDITQVDLPGGHRSGLHDAAELLDGIEGIAIRRFSHEDVVRHPLVQKIVLAYDARDAERAANLAAVRDDLDAGAGSDADAG
ncbi:MAG: PhoH family protein [Myxococcota bacterium]